MCCEMKDHLCGAIFSPGFCKMHENLAKQLIFPQKEKVNV